MSYRCYCDYDCFSVCFVISYYCGLQSLGFRIESFGFCCFVVSLAESRITYTVNSKLAMRMLDARDRDRDDRKDPAPLAMLTAEWLRLSLCVYICACSHRGTHVQTCAYLYLYLYLYLDLHLYI